LLVRHLQEPVQQPDRRPRRRREDRVRVVWVEAVEAEQGVQVDDATGLELRDLGVAEPGRDAALGAGSAGQLAFDCVDGA
jgi:hypothetical protein